MKIDPEAPSAQEQIARTPISYIAQPRRGRTPHRQECLCYYPLWDDRAWRSANISAMCLLAPRGLQSQILAFGDDRLERGFGAGRELHDLLCFAY